MTDHYKQLGVLPGAKSDEIEAAFQRLLETRRAKRQRTSDLHVAHAVLSDPSLRRAYDITRLGRATSERLSDAKDAALEVLPDVNWGEVAQGAVQVGLKSTVLVSGAMAKVADVVGSLSRRVQVEAAKRITPPETN